MPYLEVLKQADVRFGHNNFCINTAARGFLGRNFKFNARPHCTLNKLPFRHFFSSGVSVNGPNFDTFRNAPYKPFISTTVKFFRRDAKYGEELIQEPKAGFDGYVKFS